MLSGRRPSSPRGVRALAAAAALAATGAAVPADTVTLTPTLDTTLYDTVDGMLANGAGTGLFVGKNGAAQARRALVAFDLSGSIPAGSTVTSVSLRLYMNRTIAGAQTVSVHRVLATWGEGASVGPGNGGFGAQSLPQDATWLHRTFPDPAIPGSGTMWAMPGGDFAAAASASRSVAAIGAYVWASTPQLVADVQSWVDDPAGNAGWLLKGNEASSRTAKRFESRETTIAANQPRLTIEFTPPAPSCPADFDHNGAIEPADVAVFVNVWFQSLTAGTLDGDFDGSGVVDPADVGVFVSAWFGALSGSC